MPVEIPFDSLVLASVADELKSLAGAYIKRIWQPEPWTIVILFGDKMVLLSADPQAPRAHLTAVKPQAQEPDGFGRFLREKLGNARLQSVEMAAFDRELVLGFAHADLKCEFRGTRANITLLDKTGYTLGRLRKVSNTASLLEPPSDLAEALRTGNGLSPFLKKELELQGAEAFLKPWDSVYYAGIGAYPFPSAQITESKPLRMASISAALEKHYQQKLPLLRSAAIARTLRGQLERARDARLAGLAQMESVLETASRAREYQMRGELILAFAHELQEGARTLRTHDYDGSELEIKLNPSITPIENAQRYFEKAKKAKSAAAEISTRVAAMRSELEELTHLLERLDELSDVPEIEQRALAGGWLRENMSRPDLAQEQKPYAGFRIKEATSASGHRILWAENATSNDYLTTKVAKPNDIWMHVRGGQGAHVVIQTQNHPEKIQPDTLAFAARIAALHSGQKHARHVPVTYTLSKYVRKPRKSGPGAVTFTNDKTIFVDP